MTDIPVSGAVLEWARKFRGLQEKEAAELIGITVDDLKAFETEKRFPSIGIFEEFAAKYRLPQATLFRVTPPPMPKAPQDFRTLEGRPARHSFNYNVALGNIRTWLGLFEKVAKDDDEFVVPNLPRLSLAEDDPAAAGERERRRLGIGVDDQFALKTKGEAFRFWRGHLEKSGISVFQQKFSIDDCRGFSLYDSANAPCVVVNKDDTVDVAKSFTLIHEYCHLLVREPGVSDHNSKNPVEAFCNRFAAGFLIPPEALRRLLPVWPNAPVEWAEKDVARWATRLKVSQIALALRLEQLGLAPAGFSRKFNWGKPPAKRKSSGGNYVATRLSEIGLNYSDKVLSAFDRQVIDEVQAVEALGLGTEHFDTVRKTIGRVRELIEPVPVAKQSGG
jgi:Zn-dependent peptidase ImmA (M78 family)